MIIIMVSGQVEQEIITWLSLNTIMQEAHGGWSIAVGMLEAFYAT